MYEIRICTKYVCFGGVTVTVTVTVDQVNEGMGYVTDGKLCVYVKIFKVTQFI